MTEPYTVEELTEAIKDLEYKASATYWPVRYSRLAATLKEYERVVKENAELRERLDHYREHRALLEAEVAVLRPNAERWQAFAPSLDIRKGCWGEWILWPYNAVHGWEDRPESVNAAADRIVNAARAAGEG